jgi:CheY-like chemotaxis protein
LSGSAIYFCPQCISNQPTFQYFTGQRLIIRCQNCGYPVEAGAIEKDTIVFRKPKILVIDDDRLLLGLLSDLLTAHECRPLTATDGPSGIEAAKHEHPDLILLDIFMPGLDGFEACRQLRAEPDLKDTPIIIMTALMDPKLTVKGFKAGATLAVRKPVDPQRLIDILKTALALKPRPPAPS